MANINAVCISGNLTRDPETRITQGGSQVMTFGIAVNERVKNGEKWGNRPNYFDVVVFGKSVDWLSRELAKGTKVSISGRLRYSSWDGDDGSRHSKVEVIANQVDVMTGRSHDSSSPANGGTAKPTQPTQNAIPYDVEIPF